MSQSSSQSIAPLGLAARPAWISDKILASFVPWFRAVLDSMLISLGVMVAFMTTASAVGGSFECRNWQQAVFMLGQVTLGITGTAIVYFTARSSRRRERQTVLVCLSIVLFLYAGMSLVSMLLIAWPESMNDVRMIVAGVTSGILVCIGMIAVEKRLLARGRSATVVERIASGRQTLERILWGGLAFIVSITCLLTPASIMHGMVSGSLWGYLEMEFGGPINSTTTYLSLVLLMFGASLYQITLATLAWIYLAEFHRESLRSSKEIRLPFESVHSFILAFWAGTIVYCVLYALLQFSPSTAPWAVLVISSGAYLAYRKTTAKVAAEMSE